MPPAGFEPELPATQRSKPKRAATGISWMKPRLDLIQTENLFIFIEKCSFKPHVCDLLVHLLANHHRENTYLSDTIIRKP